MNKLLSTFLVIATILILSACSANSSQANKETPKMVNVEIMIPGKISSHKASVLSVKLTQGSEIVDDADVVEFEIWKANKNEESKMIKAHHEKGGVYSIKTTFKEDGLYYVQTHVTARDLHVMPKKPFIVGKATEEELNSLKEESQNQEQSPNHSHHHH